MSEKEIALLKSLKTLQHKVDFTKPFTDHIFGRAPITCASFHPSQTCSQYWVTKFQYQLRTSVKVQIIAFLLPSLIMQARTLHIDTLRKLKELFIKFCKATFYIAWGAAFPWVALCILSKFGIMST